MSKFVLPFLILSIVVGPGVSAQPVCSVGDGGTAPGGTVNNSPPLSGGLLTVPVFVHVITGAGGAGAVTDAQINQQITALNTAFVSYSVAQTYTFELVGISRVQNDTWFTGIGDGTTVVDSTFEGSAKRALTQDPAHVLNLYTSKLPSRTGTARFPFPFPFTYPDVGMVSWAEDSYWHGVVVDYRSMPGGSDPRNTGDVGVHEVGHYLGLYHTYRDDCAGSSKTTCATQGDEVCDTNQHDDLQISATTCDAVASGCPNPDPNDLPPVNNFMNGTPEFCQIEFTRGQGFRMQMEVGDHRPSLGYGAPLVTRVSLDVEVTLEPGWDYEYAVDGSLRVEGTLNAPTTSFSALDPVVGWEGIRVFNGGTLHLTGSTVEKVDLTPPPGPFTRSARAAVTVYDGDLTLTGGAIRGTTSGSGLYVADGSADVTGGAVIENNEMHGVWAGPSGVVNLSGGLQTLVSNNDLGGVRAQGQFAFINVNGALVDNNFAEGVHARNGGSAYFYGTASTVSNNRGGLYAPASGVVYAGECVNGSSTVVPNDFVANTPVSGTFDVRTLGGSSVWAEANSWGTAQDEGDLLIDDGNGSGFYTVTPFEDACGALVAGRRGDFVPTASRALAAAARGEMEEAVALAERALDESAWEDYDAAFAAVGHVAGRADSDRLLARLNAEAAAGRSAAPWALTALATANEARGDHEQALLYSRAAVAVAPQAGEKARALMAEAWSAVARASSRLGDAEAAWEAVDTATEIDAVVGDGAAAFVLAALDGRRADGFRRPAFAGSFGGKRMASASEAFHVGAVTPNPTSGRAEMSLILDDMSEVHVDLYDALGRRVGAVPARRFGDGSHRLTLPVDALPSGVYVVRVLSTPDGNAPSAHVRRFVVTR